MSTFKRKAVSKEAKISQNLSKSMKREIVGIIEKSLKKPERRLLALEKHILKLKATLSTSKGKTKKKTTVNKKRSVKGSNSEMVT